MKRTCLKFLPVFLISIVCLIASVGFTGVNAHAEDSGLLNSGVHTVTFTEQGTYGKIEGPTEYVYENDDSLLFAKADNPTIKIFKFRSMTTTEIKADPDDNGRFVNWTRSDGKEMKDEITSDVEFVAHFIQKGNPLISFKADSEYGSIEGTTLYEFNEDCSITSNVNESTFKIFQFAVESKTTEINAVPIPGYAFDSWTRSDGKEFNASIYSDVEFTAHFKPGKRDSEMKDLSSRDAFFHVIDGSSCECHQVIFRKSNTELVVKSSNEDIATVSVIKTPQDQEAVLICGHNVGKVTITVTSTGSDIYKEATKSFNVDVFGKVPLPVVHTTLKYNGASQVGIESSKYYTLQKATGIPFQEGVITEKGYEGTNIGVYAGYIDLKPGYYWEDDTSGSKYYEFRIVKGEE